MPIRPENKARYPANWKTEIVPHIRARSGNRCECTGQCGKDHSDHGGRCAWHHGQVKDRGAMIVLTTAHLDHTPENCDDENLLHLCQGCHLRYDAPRKRRDVAERRRAERAAGDLFHRGT